MTARAKVETAVLPALRVSRAFKEQFEADARAAGLSLAAYHRYRLAPEFVPVPEPPSGEPIVTVSVDAAKELARQVASPTGLRAPCECPRPKPQGPSVKYGVCPSCHGQRR